MWEAEEPGTKLRMSTYTIPGGDDHVQIYSIALIHKNRYVVVQNSPIEFDPTRTGTQCNYTT